MNRSRHLQVTALALLCTSAASFADEPLISPGEPIAVNVPPHGQALETIEVFGRRETRRQAINSYVSTVTKSDGENLVLWHEPVCLYASGMSVAQTDFLRLRMSEIAGSAGIPWVDAPGCDPNLFVFLTNQSRQLISELWERNPRMFGNEAPRQAEQFRNYTRPVRAWYIAKLVNIDGTPPIEGINKAPKYRLQNSRIASSVAEHMTSVVIVVDLQVAPPVPLTRLADFVSMVAFTRVGLDTDYSGTPTILRLFSGPAPGSEPAGLTAWDTAFLRGLYQTDQTVLHQDQQIVSSMNLDLASQSAP